jgi:hypothetical protein
VGGGLRLGFGRSYRIGSQFEIGFDFTLLDGFAIKAPEPEDAPEESESTLYARGMTLYGLRLGAKFRPYSNLTPEGYGFEAAVAGSFQPPLKPVIGVERAGDSTYTGGLVGGEDADQDNPRPVFNQLKGSFQLMGLASYRARRIMVDVGIVSEFSQDEDPEDADELSPLAVFDGVSPRIGASYRLTPSIAVGGAFWGKGATPWRDHIVINSPGKENSCPTDPNVVCGQEDNQFGALLQFGSRPEAGMDLMVVSPTGAFGESLRILFRWRGTQ